MSNKDRLWICTGIILVLLLTMYHFRFGEESYVRIHDYVEQHVAVYKTMHLSDLFTFEKTFDPYLGGIPRNTIGSEFNLGILLHTVLPPFVAVVLNILLIRLVAFTGLYLFLRQSIRIDSTLLAFSTAATFAALPFYPSIYLSIAGLPLIAWALINISRQVATNKEYIICLFFPLCIEVVGLPGIWLFFFLMVVCHWLMEKRFSFRVLLIIFCMTLVLFLAEWRLLTLGFFDQEFISHRTENTRYFLDPGDPQFFLRLFMRMGKGIVVDQYMHSPAFHQYLLLPFAVVVTLFSFFDKAPKTHEQIRKIKYWLWLIVGVFAVSIFIRLSSYLLQIPYPLFREFQMERITWLYPPLMYIFFALSVTYIFCRYPKPYVKVIIFTLIIANCAHTVIRTKDLKHYDVGTYDKMTYADFFAEPIFNDIHTYLEGESVDRVVSVGINPSVALYNGFRTADGYWPMYDLHYKHRFREVISSELDKNEKLKEYFDDWGHRVHMFYAEQKLKTWRKPKKNLSKEFSYNTEALLKLNVTHAFSVIKVKNPQRLGWKYEGTFCHKNIPYCIHLYKVGAENWQGSGFLNVLLQDNPE